MTSSGSVRSSQAWPQVLAPARSQCPHTIETQPGCRFGSPCEEIISKFEFRLVYVTFRPPTTTSFRKRPPLMAA